MSLRQRFSGDLGCGKRRYTIDQVPQSGFPQVKIESVFGAALTRMSLIYIHTDSLTDLFTTQTVLWLTVEPLPRTPYCQLSLFAFI